MYQKFEAVSRLGIFVENPNSPQFALDIKKEFELLHDASSVEEEAGILERLLEDQKIVIEAFKRKAKKLGSQDSERIESILTETLHRLGGFERSVRQMRGDAENLIKFVCPVVISTFR